MKNEKYPKSITAEELHQNLGANSEWDGTASKLEEEHQKQVARNLDSEKPIVLDLRRAGFDVDSVSAQDFDPTSDVFPVLFHHLSLFDAYTADVRLALAGTLQSKNVKGHFLQLLQAFKNEPDMSDSGIKHRLGIAILMNYVDKYAKDVAALALDSSHGRPRGWLVEALEKSKQVVARATIEKLKFDPEMAPWLEKIESKRKKKDARGKKKRRDSLKNLRSDLKETSTSLDVDTVPTVLKAVAAKIETGFGDAQVRKVAREVKAMDHNEESVLEFKVKPKWVTRTLQILIQKSDVDVANLHFFAASSLITTIDNVLEEIMPDLDVDVDG